MDAVSAIFWGLSNLHLQPRPLIWTSSFNLYLDIPQASQIHHVPSFPSTKDNWKLISPSFCTLCQGIVSTRIYPVPPARGLAVIPDSVLPSTHPPPTSTALQSVLKFCQPVCQTCPDISFCLTPIPLVQILITPWVGYKSTYQTIPLDFSWIWWSDMLLNFLHVYLSYWPLPAMPLVSAEWAMTDLHTIWSWLPDLTGSRMGTWPKGGFCCSDQLPQLGWLAVKYNVSTIPLLVFQNSRAERFRPLSCWTEGSAEMMGMSKLQLRESRYCN